MKRGEQTMPNALDEGQCEVEWSAADDGNHDVLQPNVKFASLKKQALFYGDIPDDDPTDYHDVDVEQGSSVELADAIDGLITSAEKAGMSQDGVQSLRQLLTECKDVVGSSLAQILLRMRSPLSSSCATVQNPFESQLASTHRRS
jgi:hypothetical protein